MTNKLTNLFVYGTLINRERRVSILGKQCEFARDVWIFDYKRGHWHSYPAIYPSIGNKVGGIVLKLDDCDMILMDQYEGGLYKLYPLPICNKDREILYEGFVYRPVNSKDEFMALFVIMSGCSSDVSTDNEKSQMQKQGNANIQVDPNTGMTTEQENIIQAKEDDNKPGATKHFYCISAFSGDVLIYGTVRNKVTSSTKRLLPKIVASVDGEYVDSDLRGIRVIINGRTHRTPEVMGEDQTFGSSIPYLYFWTPDDIRHKHYVSGGHVDHISNVPLNVGKVVINIE